MHFNSFPTLRIKKPFSSEARPKLFQCFKCHSKLHNQNYSQLPTQTVVLHSASFVTHKPAPSSPIIWDYVKCFPTLHTKYSASYLANASRTQPTARKRLFANFYNHPKKRIKCAEAPKVLWLKVKL